MNPNIFLPQILPTTYQHNSLPPAPIIQQMIPESSTMQILNPLYSNNIPPNLGAPFIQATTSNGGGGSNAFITGPNVHFPQNYLPSPSGFGGHLSFPSFQYQPQSSSLQQQSAHQSVGIPSGAVASPSSPQPLLQFSISPSIPQPNCVIIDGTQYLEFISQIPGEQPQYIPLQFFLQPQNFIESSHMDSLTSKSEAIPMTASSTSFTKINNSSQSISQPHISQQSPSNISIKMDSTEFTSSPPKKVRRMSPPKRKSNQSSSTTQKLDRFLSSTQRPSPSANKNSNISKKDDSDSDIEVLSETITAKELITTDRSIPNEIEIISDNITTKTVGDGIQIIDKTKAPQKAKERTAVKSCSSSDSHLNNNSNTPNKAAKETTPIKLSTNTFQSVENRIRANSSLNEIEKTIPLLDFNIVSEVAKQVVPIILEVIPNAIINAVGPALHECGSYFNVSIDEDTKKTESVWFFFTLSVLVGDKKKKELESISAEKLVEWINEIEKKAYEADIVKDTDKRTQRNIHKLSLHHKNPDAKLTLLFCSQNALKRSQLIRLYCRCDKRMLSLAYLYNNLILNEASLHSITNTPICYLIIYFLQQTERVRILHQADPDVFKNIDLFSPTDIGDKRGRQYLCPKSANDSVALLVYDFAKFYSSFDFDKIVIDITQKPIQFSKETDERKKPLIIKCSYTYNNLATSITPDGLASFVQKLKEIIKAFENGKESEMFASNLDEFARKPMKPSRL